MKSKICGISTTDILEYITSHPYPPELIGFICNYKKSKRFIELNKLKKLLKIKKKNSKYVAVLVKPTEKELKEISNLPFDYYQLYDMSLEKIKKRKQKYNKKIIVALSIDKKKDAEKYRAYKKIKDVLFLFDSKGYEKSLSFDHKHLDALPNNQNFMIAGNIKPDDNLKMFKKLFNYVDISGGVESENGIKDKEKINQFLLNIKKTNDEA
jgi:phosphoribosylanthranilate isomerase